MANNKKWKKTPWQRIIIASENGLQLFLDADEVFKLASDDAIVTKAMNDDEEEETGKPGDIRR